MEIGRRVDAMTLIYPFALAVGDFVHQFGLKRIHGQVWAYLYASTHNLDASSIARSLKVSKAQMSITLKSLTQLGAVEVSGRTTYGRTLYRANPDLMQTLQRVLQARSQTHLSAVEAKLKPIARISSLVEGVSEDRIQELMTKIQSAIEPAESLTKS